MSRVCRTAAAAPVGLERPGACALFDLDRTLVPGSSLVALGRALAQRRLVGRRALARGVAANLLFARRGASDDAAQRVRDRALAVMAGIERDPLLELVDDVGHRLAGVMYPGARWALERHLEAGDFCVVVSAAPQELVDAVVRSAGFHRGVGTRGEVRDGCFTGRLDGAFCYGPGKLERVADEVGEIDGRTTAYADSGSDIPLLRASGRPVAVNPDRRMAAAARAAGWPVLRFQ
jgi:HAD superfamily hydrolase (TIGR01490 family)